MNLGQTILPRKDGQLFLQNQHTVNVISLHLSSEVEYCFSDHSRAQISLLRFGGSWEMNQPWFDVWNCVAADY